eukprot:Seg1660.5 transcript_id=Seg1660.5/GoldUCD/mRNA.D3Y31 product="Dynein heavy chain 8 axonemal" protein_id=Seg1660.5/GoldUCD/D3Y31
MNYINVPQEGKELFLRKESLQRSQSKLKVMIEAYEELKESIPVIFAALMKPSMNKVEAAIAPGLVLINWNSMTIDQYTNIVLDKIKGVDHLNKQLLDIRDARIDAGMEEICEMLLCELPEDEGWTIERFAARTKEICDKSSVKIQQVSTRVETAVYDLLDILSKRYEEIKAESHIPNPYEIPPDETSEHRIMREKVLQRENDLEEEANELVNFFNHKLVDSLLRCIRNSIDLIKRRVFPAGRTRNYGKRATSDAVLKQAEQSACLSTDMTLAIPNVVVNPSLEDIQQCLNESVKLILNVSQNVASWCPKPGKFSQAAKANADSETTTQKQKNYYKYIAEHKDTTKITMMVSSAISTTKIDAAKNLNEFSKFMFLWKEDRDSQIQLGWLSGSTVDYQFEEPLKLALIVEAENWKFALGRSMNAKYKEKLDSMVNFIADYSRRLIHPIEDLDDESYSLLNSIGIPYPKEESDKCDSLRYSVQKLLRQAVCKLYCSLMLWTPYGQYYSGILI